LRAVGRVGFFVYVKQPAVNTLLLILS